MASPDQQLQDFVKSMFDDGVLDDNFRCIQMLQNSGNPGFVAEIISVFTRDSDRILGEINKLMDQTVVDYRKVEGFVHTLKGSSSSVGAQKVGLACLQLRQFCKQKNKQESRRALQVLQHESSQLKSKFETIVELEQKIEASHTKK